MNVFRALGRGFGHLKAKQGFKRTLELEPHFKLALFVLLGTVPTFIMGILFRDIFEKMFASVTWTGVMLLITGGFLWIAESVRVGNRDIGQMKVLDTMLIGMMQGLAIAPGISRSGATIACSLFRGLDRSLAIRYSFLLSIPVILGAVIFQLVDCAGGHAAGVGLAAIIIATITAAITGYLAIKLLIIVVQGKRLKLFSYYCWLLGIGIIAANYLK